MPESPEWWRNYRQENAEALNAKRREWRAKNKDMVNAYKRKLPWEKKTVDIPEKTEHELLETRLRRLRLTKGITLADVGRAVGLSSKMPQRWEAGNSVPQSHDLPNLARLYNVTIDYLLTGKESSRYAVILAAIRASGTKDARLLAFVER